ncbi:MAG: dihydrofolate reductase family protein [Bacteroidota bacterium]|nr:dihydrofolate reductase family protein [Bacteroidota bacterium]
MKARILNSPEARTIIAVTQKAPETFIESVGKKSAEVMVCPEADNRVDLNYLVRKLGEMGIDSILIEAGGELNFSALRQGIVDKVYAFIAAKIIGGKTANTPMGGAGFEKISEAVDLNITGIEKFKNDILIEAYMMGK